MNSQATGQNKKNSLNMNIFLMIGQSNMQGIKQPFIKNRFSEPRLFVLEVHENGGNRSVRKWIPSGESEFLNTSISIAPGFVTKMLEYAPNSKIGIIPIAIGGTSIKNWIPSSSLYPAVIDLGLNAAKDGQIAGYKLRRFSKGSPLELLGAKKGDIIHSVNGTKLTSVDQALNAYQNLRTNSRLTFSITRKGKPMDLSISVR